MRQVPKFPGHATDASKTEASDSNLIWPEAAGIFNRWIKPELKLELERAQIFRARAGFGHWVSDSVKSSGFP